jgi:hypothetical protein
MAELYMLDKATALLLEKSEVSKPQARQSFGNDVPKVA